MVLSVIVFANEADGAGLVWRAVSKLGSLISDLGDVAGGCTNGQIMEYQTSNSTWICATDDTGSGSGFTNIASAPATTAKLIQDNSTVTTSVTLKTLTAGTGISLTNNTSDVVITSSVVDTGFTNIASESFNGANATIIADNSTVTNRASFKTISSGSGITLTQNANNIIINMTTPINVLSANVTTITPNSWTTVFNIPLTANIGNVISGVMHAASSSQTNGIQFNQNITNTNHRGSCLWVSPGATTAAAASFDIRNASDGGGISGQGVGTADAQTYASTNGTVYTFTCGVTAIGGTGNLMLSVKNELSGGNVNVTAGSYYIKTP